MVQSEYIEFSTNGDADMVDVTEQVAQVVAGSGLASGIVTLFTPSATSGLTTIEYESGSLSDLRRLFDEIVDPQQHYAHNARWGDGNGHSHVRAALLGPSLKVNCAPCKDELPTGGRSTKGKQPPWTRCASQGK